LDASKIVIDFLIGFLGLGIMIFVHELGHLLAAKSLKVKVETFSIGYGKKLVGFKRGDTTYQLGWFPFGGFTKFKGEHLFAQAIEQNLDRIPADADCYYNQPAWKRVIISFAGPAFNILFAFIFFTLVYWVGFYQNTYGNRVILASEVNAITTGVVPGETYPADAAGLMSGDTILKIDDTKILQFDDIMSAIASAPNRQLKFRVARLDGTIHDLVITPRLVPDKGIGQVGIQPDAEAIVAEGGKPDAIQNQWIEPGDRFITVAGRPVNTFLDFLRAFRERPKFLPVTVSRSGTEVKGIFYPQYQNMFLGLNLRTESIRTPSYSLPQSMEKSLDQIGQTAYSIALFFSLIPKINVANSVSGPIRTTYYIGEAARQGFMKSFDQGVVQFIRILCLLSVILAIMNLLPLPVLDGGFIILFLIEWIKRKPFRPKFIYIFQIVGIVFMVAVGLFVIVNDFLHPW
jgi:regulator of sigma E protease